LDDPRASLRPCPSHPATSRRAPAASGLGAGKAARVRSAEAAGAGG